MALKQAETNSKRWILRCYECEGGVSSDQGQRLQVVNLLGLNITAVLDGLERPIQDTDSSDFQSTSSVQISPWQILSLELADVQS